MTFLDEAGRTRWLLDQLRAAVARLASSADDQLAYVRQLGSSPSVDELALEFDDFARAVLAQPRLLTDEQRMAVENLDRQLDAMSGADRAALWTEAALGSAEEWHEVRRRAARAWSLLR